MFEVDWAGDAEERTREPWVKYAYDKDLGAMSINKFINKRNTLLSDMWVKMEAKDIKFETFFRFMTRRFEWCKSGSAATAKGKLKMPDGMLGDVRPDKRNASAGSTAAVLA